MSSSSLHQFERHTREVYAWAYRLLGRHEDALDVVQDVFLRWADQCRSAVPDQPRGWLRRVTLNRAIDVRRHRREQGGAAAGERVAAVPISTLRVEPGRGDPLSPNGQAVVDNPGEALDASAIRGRIAAALAELTDIQRSVVASKVYDGLTFAEIAAEHGLAVSTVKTHYLRALRALRDVLGPAFESETNP